MWIGEVMSAKKSSDNYELRSSYLVIPAKAGIQVFACIFWIPASAGMTEKCEVRKSSTHAFSYQKLSKKRRYCVVRAESDKRTRTVRFEALRYHKRQHFQSEDRHYRRVPDNVQR